jgi:hypothetical protein
MAGHLQRNASVYLLVLAVLVIAYLAVTNYGLGPAAAGGGSQPPVCTIDGDRSNDAPGCVMPGATP